MDFEQKSADQKTVATLKEKFKKKFDAHEADPKINEIVQSALKKCNVNQPIIVIQNDTSDFTCVTLDPYVHPQVFMLIGTKGRTQDQIIGDIYHEVGHIVNGDVSQTKKINLFRTANFGIPSVSVLTGLLVGSFFKNYMRRMPITSIFLGLTASISTFFISRCYFQHKESIQEGKADAFEYEHLLKDDRLDIAINQISEYILKDARLSVPPLPSFIGGYPTPLERAKIGLRVLEKNNFNIAELINNLPENLDERVKQDFPWEINKFCPEFLKPPAKN
jgi:hypothetical protein